MKTGIFTGVVCIMMLWGTVNAGDDMMKVQNINSVSQTQWDALAQKKIYFGHQSVGYNIIDGIKDIMAKNPAIRLDIVETRDPADFNAPVFAHSSVGRNKDPYSKIDDFKEIIDSGVGDRVDIAFFKFCYVDVTAETDIASVFDYYVKSVKQLQKKYPDVEFFHCTVPLTAPPVGLKTKIKSILGKLTWTNADNSKRNDFNQMLIEKFGDRVFDLAAYETTGSNQEKSFFMCNKVKQPCLAREWTFDGGHLNMIGRQYIAEEFLLFLANCI